MNKEERKELMEQLFKENEQKEYNCRNCEYSQDIKHFTSNCKLHYGGVLNSDAKHCMYYMTNYMELNDDGSKTEKRYHHHIKYSDDEGKTFTENNGEVIGKYIGTLMDYNEDASNNPSDYKWMPRQWSKRD